MSRPSVDVVVPFAGSDAALARIVARLDRLALRPGDTVVVADNRRDGGAFPAARQVARIAAGGRRSSYHARNRGAAAGEAAWIVFLDADVDPPPDLLDLYFAAPPATRAGALVGAIEDAAAADPFGDAVAAHASLAQDVTLGRSAPYAQTANCAVRRAAFEAVGGFADDVLSGGDADLCFRLRAAGWALERRDRARVVHANRESLRAVARQKLRHGAGAAWVNACWPGAIEVRDGADVARHAARGALSAAVARLARNDPAAARAALVAPVADVAFWAGRHLPNRAPHRSS